jgi:4-amino-4-deoxy-L-arabinose transferase-like glycosyltransferase
VAACVAGVLISVSGRYGYHRDELYFLAAGHHLAWGYPDQPPLVPLLARLMSELSAGSVMVLRLPSAFAAAGVVVFTGLLARELGAKRGAQLLAAISMAVASLLLGAGHLLSTTTYDLLAWATLLWLVVRILRTGDDRLWVVVGVVAGIGLLDSDLVAFLIGAIAVAILLAGPRRTFASPWVWIGGILAAAIWTPYLIWQAGHGWPQLTVSRAIATGSSGTSEPRALFIPLQLGLVSPYLAPVWIAGLVRLLRDKAIRWCRPIGWAYVILAAVFLVTGGKPYYLGGMFPALLAAGAQPTIDWMNRTKARLRSAVIAGAIALSAVGSVLITLPVIPMGTLHLTPIVSFNYDTGETLAWPTYVRQLADVYSRLPPGKRSGVVILTSNYGEAGAVDRFGPASGLPPSFSGHNGYWYWGPPPASTRTVLAVGFERSFLERFFGDVRLETRLDNHLDLNTQEQNAPVWLCSQVRGDWPTLWPRFRHLG